MIGSVISHYKIVEKLGGGGMGVVYKAQDLKLGRFVALKFLPTSFLYDEETKQMFINEAKSASSLQHNNICTIHEIDETENLLTSLGKQLFICMDYYEGETLKKKIKRGVLDLYEIIDIGIQIAKGLSVAHSKEIIHRDIKPANIFITNDGIVKILDFGLAKTVSRDTITQIDSTMGTVAYMSPEQARGEEVDYNTDIWAFGVVLYEMLTGELPFKGEYDQAIIYSILNEDVKMPHEIDNRISRVILKCLNKNPYERYNSFNEIVDELETLKEEIKKTTSISNKNNSSKTKRKNKRILLPLGILLIFILILTIIKILFFTSPEKIEPINIAVISFENQTGDKKYDYLQKAIPNLLITNLEQSKHLRVVTWERMYDLLKQIGKENVGTIDKDLGFEICKMDKIDAIVLGSFIKAGNRFATDVKVLDVQTKKLLKSVSTQGEGAESILEDQIDYLSDKISEGLGLSASEIESVKFRIANVSTKSLEAYKNYIEGRSYFDKLYYEEAIPFFEKAIELDSNFAMAYMYLGRSYAGDFNHVKERKAIVKAQSLKKYATDKEKIFIEAYYQDKIKGNSNFAMKIIKKGIIQYPKEKFLHLWLGELFAQKKNYQSAIKSYLNALELDPHFKTVLNLISYSYSNIKDYEKAIRYLKLYVTLNPNEANPYDSMGDIYFKMAKLDSSIVSYKRALEIKPDFSSFWKMLIIYIIKEDYQKAINELHEHWLASNSISKRIIVNYAMTAIDFYLGKYKEAINYLNKVYNLAEQINNDFWKEEVYWRKGWIYYHSGELNKSFSSFTTLYNMQKTFQRKNKLRNEGYYNFYKGILNIKNGKVNLARNNLMEIFKIIPTQVKIDSSRLDYHCKLLYGEILLEEDSLSKAEKVFSELPDIGHIDFSSITLFRDISSPLPKDGLARTLAKEGKNEMAVKEYQLLVASNPIERGLHVVLPVYHYRLAKLYEKISEKQKAILQYKKLLNIWKDADKNIKELIEARKRYRELTTQLN